MSALSPYLRDVEGGGLSFWCAGCKQRHTIMVGEGLGSRWGWNGDAYKPVFTPSVLVTGRDFTPKGEADFDAWCAAGHPKPGPEFESADTRCHTFVSRDGQRRQARGRRVTCYAPSHTLG